MAFLTSRSKLHLETALGGLSHGVQSRDSEEVAYHMAPSGDRLPKISVE